MIDEGQQQNESIIDSLLKNNDQNFERTTPKTNISLPRQISLKEIIKDNNKPEIDELGRTDQLRKDLYENRNKINLSQLKTKREQRSESRVELDSVNMTIN